MQTLIGMQIKETFILLAGLTKNFIMNSPKNFLIGKTDLNRNANNGNSYALNGLDQKSHHKTSPFNRS